MAAVMSTRTPQTYEYDFMVLYTEEDSEWTEKFVVEAEKRFHKRGYYVDRDGILGVYNFDNLIRSLEISERTFVILSPNTNQNEQHYFEGLNVLESYLEENRQINRERLVPIIIEGGRLPAFLRVFSKIERKNKYFWNNVERTLTTPLGATIGQTQARSSLSVTQTGSSQNCSSLAPGIQDTEVSSSREVLLQSRSLDGLTSLQTQSSK
ncbi:uncharacterized protein LOC144435617 isoform X2 [Glandiceps talaboti]